MAALLSCYRDVVLGPATTGSIEVHVVSQIGSPTSIDQIDSARAMVSGPSESAAILASSPNGFTGTIDGLAPGTYRLAVIGLIGGETADHGSATDIVVQSGLTTNATIGLSPFVPQVDTLPAQTTNARFALAWRAVAGADSYQVEMDRSAMFPDPVRLTTVDTGSELTLPDTTPYHIRVRASTSTLPRGRASAVRATQLVVNRAEPGDNEPATATWLGFGASAARSYAELNILPAGDLDWFSIQLCQGDTLTVTARAARLSPASPLNSQVGIFNPGDTLIVSAEDGDGTDARASVVIRGPGKHRIRVSGANQTTGQYELVVQVQPGPNAGPESCRAAGSPVAQLVITPKSGVIAGAETSQAFTAEARDSAGNPVAGKTSTWVSLNPAIATISSSTGVASPVSSGQATISAAVDGVVGYALLNVSLPGAAAVGSFTTEASGTSEGITAVWGASSTELYAAAGGRVLRHDGTSWVPLPGGTMQPLRRIWGLSASDVYAVGATGVVLRYHDGALSSVVSGTSESLMGVWGSSPANLFVVGGNGAILRYDGAAWAAMPSRTAGQLNAVWGVAPDDAYAVGADGIILRYDGKGWSPMASGTSQPLYGLWGLSPRDLWAVGAGGTIRHYDGNGWTGSASGVTADLRAVWGTSPSDIYAVGAGGTVLRYDGAGWMPVARPSTETLSGVGGSFAGSVYAVGANGTILRGVRGSAPPAVAVRVTPNAAEQSAAGGSVTFAAQALDASGQVIGGKSFSWASLNPDVATINSASGVATAAGSGQTAISASVDGVSGFALLTVAVPGAVPVGTIRGTAPPTAANLHHVWGARLPDAYAVGDAGTILHWDGAVWSRMPSGTTQPLFGLWGASATSVYAVGAGGTILYHDGGSWISLASGTLALLRHVWGASPVDVFAVGDGGTILHFNGSSWTAVPSGTSQRLTGVWGTSASNVYAVGEGGTILRFDGAAWSAATSGTSANLRAVWGTSSSDVYTVGDEGAVLRFDGAGWSPLPSGVTGSLRGVTGSSPTDVYAVGAGGTVLRFNGSRWKPYGTPSAQSLNGAVVAGPELWAVGDAGTAQRGRRGASTIGVSPAGATISTVGGAQTLTAQAFDHDGNLMPGKMFVWSSLIPNVTTVSASGVATAGGTGQAAVSASVDGVVGYGLLTVATPGAAPVGSWSPVPSGTTDSLRGIWGPSPDHVMAVGANGRILRYDGTGWTGMTSNTNQTLNGIWGDGVSEAFAVGVPGAKLRYNGTKWEIIGLPPSPRLYAIWCASPAAIFAVGDSGTVLQYDGRGWANWPSSTTQHLRAVWGTSAQDVYAVGMGGTIVHFDGRVWGPTPTSTSWPSLNGLWGVSPTEIFAVGDAGTILRYDGSTWNAMASGITQKLIAVHGTSASDVYAAGDGGVILRFDGAAWTPVASGTTGSLAGLFGTAASDMWAVGADGTILRGRR